MSVNSEKKVCSSLFGAISLCHDFVWDFEVIGADYELGTNKESSSAEPAEWACEQFWRHLRFDVIRVKRPVIRRFHFGSMSFVRVELRMPNTLQESNRVVWSPSNSRLEEWLNIASLLVCPTNPGLALWDGSLLQTSSCCKSCSSRPKAVSFWKRTGRTRPGIKCWRILARIKWWKSITGTFHSMSSFVQAQTFELFFCFQIMIWT